MRILLCVLVVLGTACETRESGPLLQEQGVVRELVFAPPTDRKLNDYHLVDVKEIP